MNLASFGAENNPLDRALGKLEGIGGGGDGGGGAPIPITLPRVLRFVLFLIGICILLLWSALACQRFSLGRPVAAIFCLSSIERWSRQVATDQSADRPAHSKS
jgi:hypothetical protein